MWSNLIKWQGVLFFTFYEALSIRTNVPYYSKEITSKHPSLPIDPARNLVRMRETKTIKIKAGIDGGSSLRVAKGLCVTCAKG